jgi:hypothetical protein
MCNLSVFTLTTRNKHEEFELLRAEGPSRLSARTKDSPQLKCELKKRGYCATSWPGPHTSYRPTINLKIQIR